MRPETIFKIIKSAVEPRTALKIIKTVLVYSKRRYFPCSVCGGFAFEKIFESGVFYTKKTVCVCKKCGTVCLNPRMDERGYTDYYQNWYHRFSQRESWDRLKSMDPYTNDEVRDPNCYAVKVFNNLKDYLSKDSKIIDIGCGAGELLILLKENGLNNLTGVEPSKECCDRLRSHYDINCIDGTLLTATYSGEYDCVILHAVLEHLADPRKALEKAKSVLKPDGIIYLTVPDLFGYEYEDKFSLFWFAHTFYPSRKSLKMLLNNTGFKIECYFQGDKCEQHLIVKKIPRNQQLPLVTENLKEYKKVIEYFLIKKRSMVYRKRS